jgi:HD-GYP domain-containing protein (c-di-GMP phosphodiesterase class II)
MSPEAAYKIILDQSGAHFDPAIVEAFARCFQEFTPAGEIAPWMQNAAHPSAVSCNPFTELAHCSS